MTLEEHQAEYDALMSELGPEDGEKAAWLTEKFEAFKAEYLILRADIDQLRVSNAALQARADRIKANRAGLGQPMLRVVK